METGGTRSGLGANVGHGYVKIVLTCGRRIRRHQDAEEKAGIHRHSNPKRLTAWFQEALAVHPRDAWSEPGAPFGPYGPALP